MLAGPSLVTFARAAVLLADDPERLRGAGRRVAVRRRRRRRGPVLDAAGADRFLALRGDDVVLAGGRATIRDAIDPTRGLGVVELDDRDLEVVATDARLRWEHAERVGARGAGRRGSRRREPRARDRRRLRQGAPGLRSRDRLLPGRQARAGRRLRAGRAAAVAGVVGGVGRRPGARRAAARRGRGQGRLGDDARAGRRDAGPGARRDRLHLGARRPPLLAPRQGRPVPARRRRRRVRRGRPPGARPGAARQVEAAGAR